LTAIDVRVHGEQAMIAPVLLLLVFPGDPTGFAKSLALVGDLDGDRCSEIAVGSPSGGAEPPQPGVAPRKLERRTGEE
jgi:hypothetical protein